MADDEKIKILTEQKDKEIDQLKDEIDLLNKTLYRSNKKMIALQHEIEELKRTGDIKNSLKEYQEAEKDES